MVTIEHVNEIKGILEKQLRLGLIGDEFIENKNDNYNIVYQDDENVLMANAYCVSHLTLLALFDLSRILHFKISIINSFPSGFSLVFTIV